MNFEAIVLVLVTGCDAAPLPPAGELDFDFELSLPHPVSSRAAAVAAAVMARAFMVLLVKSKVFS
jgi:hypothetical protein